MAGISLEERAIRETKPEWGWGACSSARGISEPKRATGTIAIAILRGCFRSPVPPSTSAGQGGLECGGIFRIWPGAKRLDATAWLRRGLLRYLRGIEMQRACPFIEHAKVTVKISTHCLPVLSDLQGTRIGSGPPCELDSSSYFDIVLQGIAIIFGHFSTGKLAMVGAGTVPSEQRRAKIWFK